MWKSWKLWPGLLDVLRRPVLGCGLMCGPHRAPQPRTGGQVWPHSVIHEHIKHFTFWMFSLRKWLDNTNAIGSGCSSDMDDAGVESIENRALKHGHAHSLNKRLGDIYVLKCDFHCVLTCGMMTLMFSNSFLTTSCTVGDSAKPPTKNMCLTGFVPESSRITGFISTLLMCWRKNSITVTNRN